MAAVASSDRSSGVESVVGKPLADKIHTSRILVVGAGGIGCELLKNLALAGFLDIVLIDLDTIDVTNLNRQFFFQKEHVGKSKAIVSAEAVKRFNPNIKVEALHGSVMDRKFNKAYFEQFDIVLNALDNIAARRHVNRMCLAALVPLIESGTKGFLGQCDYIMKDKTECYDCKPKAPQKQYPTCTIRNTPTEPIHCITWAKFLFSQLFGIPDDDNDVTPDLNDKDVASDTEEGDGGGGGGAAAAEPAAETKTRVTARMFAESVGYDGGKMFQQLFNHDVQTLLNLDKLSKGKLFRNLPQKPIPLDIANLPAAAAAEGGSAAAAAAAAAKKLESQRVWSMEKCKDKFIATVAALHSNLQASKAEGRGDDLSWDKDDEPAMEFVIAVTNLRARIFGIEEKSPFDCKSIAGNIIPAIATTNAVIAGFIVLQTFKVLAGKEAECKNMYLAVEGMSNGRIVNSVKSNMFGPNKKCATCQVNMAEVSVNTKTCTVGFLANEILKKGFGMVMPEVSRGAALLVTDFDETDEDDKEDMEDQLNIIFPKTLEAVLVVGGTTLLCEDKLQAFKFNLLVHHCDEVEDERGYVMGGNAGSAQALLEKNEADAAAVGGKAAEESDDDELQIIEQVDSDDEEAGGGAVGGGGGSGGGGAANANGKRPREDDDSATVVDDDDDDDEIQEIEAPVEPGAKRAKPT